MSKFLLSCPQGHQIAIDSSQAGCPVRCSCGAEVIAPTLRGLNQLPRAAGEDDPLIKTSASAPSNWSMREGLIFIGVIVAVLAIVPLAWLLANAPKRPTMPDEIKAHSLAEVEAMDITETMKLWDELHAPLDGEVPIILQAYNRVAGEHRQHLMMAGIGVAAGVVLAVVGMMQPKKRLVKR